MSADTSVKWMTSDMPNVPTLTGTAGSLVALLDAFLVDGADPRPINSIVIVDGIATVSLSAGHAYEPHAVIRIAGASPTALNRDWRIASATASTLTFDVSGASIADGVASGTMTARRAPAGWEIVYSATNKRVYRSTDPESLGFLLRVDDTSTAALNQARVIGYEAMADIDTGTGAFPSDAMISGGGYWYKANTSTGTRPWALFADSRTVCFYGAHHSGYPLHGSVLAFGDLIPAWSADRYAAVLSCAGLALQSSTYSHRAGNLATTLSQSVDITVPRAADALPGARSAATVHPLRVLATSQGGSGVSNGSYAPYSPSGGVFSGPVALIDDSNTLRGWLPGLESTPTAVWRGPVNFSISPVRTDGKALMALSVHHAYNGPGAAAAGTAYIDITGPWR